MSRERFEKGQRVSAVCGTVVTPYGVRYGNAVLIEGGIIKSICRKQEIPSDISREDILDIPNGYIIPGLQDLQRYGREGHSCEICSAEELIPLAESLLAEGITGFLATLANPTPKTLVALADYIDELNDSSQRARLWGAHLEGPFLSPEQHGCLKNFIKEPNLRELERWLADARGHVRLMTVAPEVIEGHRPIINLLGAFGVVVSIGHSVASYGQVKRATDFASAITHWPNCMIINKRDRGVFGAALELDELSVMIIPDGIHFVLEDWIPMLLSRKSPKKVILTSDAVPPSGLPDGEYPSIGGEKVILKNGKVTRADAPEIIAGSALQLNIGVRNLASFCPVHTAVAMATVNPLRLLGLAHLAGIIESGKYADLAILNAANFSVLATLINGKIAYISPSLEKSL